MNILLLDPFDQVDVYLRYVPSIFPFPDNLRYRDRSKLQIKRRIIDCAPSLDFDIFTTGSVEEAIELYIRGISIPSKAFSKFGYPEELHEKFSEIIETAIEKCTASIISSQ
jgi:hypothetical protein